MRPSEVSLDQMQVGEVTQNGRGGKTASISVKSKPLHTTLRNCTTPFEVSSYDRVSDRKSLDVRADDNTIAFVGRLDTQLNKYTGKVGCTESGYTSLLKQQKRRAAHRSSARRFRSRPRGNLPANSLKPAGHGG